jgi:hypothetical protein
MTSKAEDVSSHTSTHALFDQDLEADFKSAPTRQHHFLVEVSWLGH